MRFLLILAFAPSLQGQGIEYIRANYTKYEYEVPMRDGKRLFTSVYVPKDQSKSYPILMQRTPYSVAPYGVDEYRTSLGPSEAFGRECFGSAGTGEEHSPKREDSALRAGIFKA